MDADHRFGCHELGVAAERFLVQVAFLVPDESVLYVKPHAAHEVGCEPGWPPGRQMLGARARKPHALRGAPIGGMGLPCVK